MASQDTRTTINGIDPGQLRQYIESCRVDPARADREPVVVGRWLGGTRSAVTSNAGGPPVYMGGDGDPSAMGMLVRTLAACDIEVMANKAALLGVEIEDLSIEVRGHFNVARYLGIDAPVGPGLQAVSYTVRLKTRGATPEQLAEIRAALTTGSPVADTLERTIPVELEFEAS